MSDERPTWDAIWMADAQNMARRSKCVRAQVGVVIVSQDQRVLSSGYNGPPSGFDAEGPCSNWCPRAQKTADEPLSGTYDDCHAAHAESNSIARADFTQMQGSTVYVSTSMCKGCAKIVANSGVSRVVYGYTDDGSDAYRSPEETERFLQSCGIAVERWSDNA